jgi:apolipoprotein D and lipocalin family protein
MGISYLGYLVIFLAVFVFLVPMANGKEDKDVPTTVESVDLDRYTGLWYEIARLPNRFQKQCVKNVTAYYRLLSDGKIEVVNRCLQTDGKADEVKGIAKVVDLINFSRLKVSFFRPLGISLFWGDYWIIGLGANYEYAVVGTPDRKYGWILARQSRLENKQLDEIFDLLRRQGYQPDDFIMTVQQYENTE